MSVDPGGHGVGQRPAGPASWTSTRSRRSTTTRSSTRSTRTTTTNDPEASVYDTSWVPDDRPSPPHRLRQHAVRDARGRVARPAAGRGRAGPARPGAGRPGRPDPRAARATPRTTPTSRRTRTRGWPPRPSDDPEVAASLAEEGGDTDVPAAGLRGAAAAGRPAGRAGRGPGVRHREGHDRLRRRHLRAPAPPPRRPRCTSPTSRRPRLSRPPRGTSRATCNW